MKLFLDYDKTTLYDIMPELKPLMLFFGKPEIWLSSTRTIVADLKLYNYHVIFNVNLDRQLVKKIVQTLNVDPDFKRLTIKYNGFSVLRIGNKKGFTPIQVAFPQSAS